MGQVVNSRSQAQQGQPVTKLETPPQTILVQCQYDTVALHKRVQSGILKEAPMVKTSLGCVYFQTHQYSRCRKFTFLNV